MQSSEAAVEQKGREERGGVGEARWQGLVMRRWAASVDLVVSRRGLDGDSGDPVRFATGLSLRLENPLSRHVPRVFPERLSARSSFLRAVSSDSLVPRPRPALITRPPPALVVISVLVADPYPFIPALVIVELVGAAASIQWSALLPSPARSSLGALKPAYPTAVLC